MTWSPVLMKKSVSAKWDEMWIKCDAEGHENCQRERKIIVIIASSSHIDAIVSFHIVKIEKLCRISFPLKFSFWYIKMEVSHREKARDNAFTHLHHHFRFITIFTEDACNYAQSLSLFLILRNKTHKKLLLLSKSFSQVELPREDFL